MLKLFSATLAACCFAASPLYAQTPDAAPGTATRLLSSAPAAQEVPIFSVAAGITYLQTDLTNTPGGAGGYLLGWYGIPEVHFTKHISGIADFTNFANYHAHATENVHGFTGGPVYALSPIFGVTPFGFVEGGAVRDSKAGVINWNPAAVGGLGFNLKLTRAIAFQVIPGEYVATKLPNGAGRVTTTPKLVLFSPPSGPSVRVSLRACRAGAHASRCLRAESLIP